MNARRPRRTRPASAAITRRRFVSMLAAGSAALAASGALAAAAKPAAKPASPKPAAAKPDAAKPSAAALQKEYDRQRRGTLETLEVLRKFPLPPGGDLPVVFRPLRPTRSKER